MTYARKSRCAVVRCAHCSHFRALFGTDRQKLKAKAALLSMLHLAERHRTLWRILLRVMPDSKAKALSPADLFEAAVIPSRTTGNRALRELLSASKIQRIGEPKPGQPCRYFKRDA